MTNEDRYTLANSTDAEVLVSVHLNGSIDHTMNGTMNTASMFDQLADGTIANLGTFTTTVNLTLTALPQSVFIRNGDKRERKNFCSLFLDLIRIK